MAGVAAETGIPPHVLLEMDDDGTWLRTIVEYLNNRSKPNTGEVPLR